MPFTITRQGELIDHAHIHAEGRDSLDGVEIESVNLIFDDPIPHLAASHSHAIIVPLTERAARRLLHALGTELHAQVTSLHYEPERTADQRWHDDGLQFMRLLGEMAQSITLSDRQRSNLCAAMDVTNDEIFELLTRASTAWDDYKETIR